MKHFFKLTLVIITAAIVFSSCSKTNKQGKWIPKNAMAVIDINTKSLTSKVSWNDIKQTAWFNKLQSDSSRPAWTNKILDNPEASGIDMKSDFVIFFAKSGSETQIFVEGDVKDAKAFEDFNKNMHANVTASKDGDINMLTMNNEAVVGWNSDKFVYVFNSPSGKMNYGNYNFGDSSAANMAPAAPNADRLAVSCKNIFALKSDSSMAKNEKFTTLVNEDGDIHLWMNREEFMSSMPQLGMLSMLKLDAFFKDNISTATISFDNGKISIKHRGYASKELTDLMKKYGGGSIDKEMVKNIPSQDVDGIVTLHFKPEGLKELIKLTGMDGVANMMLAQQGFSIDDFVAANKGDILFAVSDFKMKNDTGAFSHPTPDVNFLFAASIGDKNAFDKLMNAGKKIMQGMHNDSAVHYARNDKYFAIGNNQDFVNRYIAGNNNKFDFLDKLSGHATGFFVDINKILLSITPTAQDSSAKILLNQSTSMWANVYSTGGDFKDDAFTSTTEINLVDKSTNSLKQLNKYFDDVSKVMMEKEKKDETMWKNDTTIKFTPPRIVADSPVTQNTKKAKSH